MHNNFSERLAAVSSVKDDQHSRDYLLNNHFPSHNVHESDLPEEGTNDLETSTPLKGRLSRSGSGSLASPRSQ